MPSGPPPPPGMTTVAPSIEIQTVTASAPAPKPAPVATTKQGVDLTPEEEKRRQTLLGAAVWYVNVLKFVLVPCNYPISTGENGQCSCGEATCDSKAKHPHARTGFHTDSDQQIRSERDAQNSWDERPWNICVLLGRDKGLFVFDVDARSGGLESLAKLKRDLDGVIDFDATYHYYTSSGGIHYYFRLNPDDVDSWSRLRKVTKLISQYKGIDYKINKGYTIAAPSLHISGDHYKRPPTSPMIVTELTSQDVIRYESALNNANGRGGVRMTSAIPSNYGDMVAAASLATSDAGVALGGSHSYETAIRDLAHLEQGAASRIVAHFLFYSKIPNDPYRLRDGEWNEQFHILIAKVAGHLFRDAAMSAEYYYMWTRSGGQPGLQNRRANRIFPGLYRMICEGLSEDLSEPPYHKTKPEKFYGMMSDLMFKEWENHGLEV
ncbi:DNA primase/polymerase [Gordonia phage Forza]|uniref:DNA primase/polymerase n=1 Tax=Gordonia phage Forza TaxID=2571247 RepID=A0A650F0Q7_9CAUD|nr:DNA primase/polymerase [Gordonia phage Forza]QEM41626.1 DNA primase/polymerase [Gordonia phage Boopy]QGT55151.1 DNA primase/polymerase [Gordonia phage Forza]UXE04299.1 DNA primase [Gordonia phage BlueNGold]WBF03940.1 DNA primase/polymerase [Gordonia phage Mareelih]